MGNVTPTKKDEESSDLLLDVPDTEQVCCFPRRRKKDLTFQIKKMDEAIVMLNAKIEFMNHNSIQQKTKCFELLQKQQKVEAKQCLTLSMINQKHVAKFTTMRETLEIMKIEISSAYTTQKVANSIMSGTAFLQQITQRLECLDVMELLDKFKESTEQIQDIDQSLTDFQSAYFEQYNFDEESVLKELNDMETVAHKDNVEFINHKEVVTREIIYSPRKRHEELAELQL